MDPISLIARENVANILFHAHKYDDCIREARQALDIDDNFAPAWEELGRGYEQKRMWREAQRAFKRAVEISPRGAGYVSSLCHMHAVAGRTREAHLLFEELQERAEREYVPTYSLALAALSVGNKALALRLLAKAIDQRSSSVPFIVVNPRLRALRDDRRFKAMLSRIGLAAA